MRLTVDVAQRVVQSVQLLLQCYRWLEYAQQVRAKALAAGLQCGAH